MTTVMDLEELASRVADHVFMISLYGQLTGKSAEPFTVNKTMLEAAKAQARAAMGEAEYQECVRLAQENADVVFNISYRRNIEASRLKRAN